MTEIGYQDGIKAFYDWYRKFAAWIDAYNAWVDADDGTPPPKAPRIPLRGPGYKEDDISTWPWPDKKERMDRIVKDDHDAAIPPVVVPPPVEPPPVEPPPTQKYPPRTHNAVGSPGAWRANARFCVQGLPKEGNLFVGPFGDKYDDGGRCTNGMRDESRMVAGLKGADSMDGKEPCDGYTHGGKTYGPGKDNWPADSYLK